MGDITWWAVGLCVVAAFLAGFVDAVAGGGGLIQLPALLAVFPTAPLALISGTNKSVSVVGTSAAALTYGRGMSLQARVVVPMAASAFAASAAGAALVTRLDRAMVEPIIMVVLIGVVVFTLLRPDMGTVVGQRPRGVLAACGLGAGIGFYDGIIGPGTGTFLVLGLVSVLGATFLTASAMAKAVNVATNLAALVVFVPAGHVMWTVAAAMAPANLAGGVIGARSAMSRGNSFVRAVFIGVICLLVVRLATTLA